MFDRLGLTHEDIIGALSRLSDLLGENNAKGELCLFGGSVMVLAFAARVSTKDVDALFYPADLLRTLGKQVASEYDLPENWLNDAVRGFVSARHDTTDKGLPQFPHLRLLMPVPQYLLAMKCMASRIGKDETEGDVPDIIFLIRRLGLKQPEQVLEIVAAYYPASQVPARVQFLITSLFEEGKI